MAGSYLVNPVTQLRFSEQSIADISAPTTIAPGAMGLVSTSAGAFTVKAPDPAADASCFGVRDVDGLAATNPITLDGNGQLIDGMATLILTQAGGEAVFVSDNGEWRRIVPERSFGTAQQIPISRVGDVTNSSDSSGAVIFDNSDSPEQGNVRTNRSVNQSPIDNTRAGIVNLSSAVDEGWGAFGNFSTICGRLDNRVDANRGTVGGGTTNLVASSSENGVISGGSNNSVIGAFAGAIAGGDGNQVSGDGGVVAGGVANVAGYYSFAAGHSNTASDRYRTVNGVQGVASRPAQYTHGAGNETNRPGDIQYARFFVFGHTIDTDPSVLVSVGGYANGLYLEAGKSYAVRTTVVAREVGGAGERAYWVYEMLLNADDAGVASIDDSYLVRTFKVGMPVWSIGFSVAGSGIIATFTGGAGQTVRAAVTYEWTELSGAPS